MEGINKICYSKPFVFVEAGLMMSRYGKLRITKHSLQVAESIDGEVAY